ncbi:MAG: RagB/SusD family nutrient uptake outer membrane protein [Oligoflexus sp.]|nr:RagB/SusD family nutrient uptake outer membrane protein [Pseudopedobacter sp.]
MKKILIIALAVTVSLVGVNCTKILEEKPVGLLAPEGFFKTKKDVEASIFGAYGQIASEPLFGRQFLSALMLRSDMVDIGDRATSPERIQVNDFNMDSNNGMVAKFWPVWYQVISAANTAEEGARSLGLAEADINPLIAEAKFVRAFSYFHLVRIFGDIPYISAVSSPEALKTISKTKEADVYAAIIKEMEFAKKWLPDTQPNDVRTRPTKATAAAYLASMYLTTGDFDKAYVEAKWVIDNKIKYNLILESDFQNLFRANLGNNMKEHLFAVDFVGQLFSTGGQNDDLMGPMTGMRAPMQENGFGVLVPSLKVYTDWDAADYRRAVSFNDVGVNGAGATVPYTAFSNEKRPHIAKWRRFPGNAIANGRYSDFNYPDMRYAEVLLIAAEALTEKSSAPTQEAIDYLNQIRTRARNKAGAPQLAPANLLLSSFTSKGQLIDAILDERRLELAFEFKRWYDIKRRKLGDIVFKGTNSLEPHANFDATRDYLMPLPATELQLNPNLNPQNPKY